MTKLDECAKGRLCQNAPVRFSELLALGDEGGTGEFVFALPLWWLDTRPPSFCTVLGSPNPFSGSFEVTFNIFELFGRTDRKSVV